MYDFEKSLVDPTVSEQAWSENYQQLYLEQLEKNPQDLEYMIYLATNLPNERRNWLIDVILELNSDYSQQFVEQVFDGTIPMAQIVYSYRGDYNFPSNLLNTIESILALDKKSEISQSLLAGRIIKHPTGN